MGAGALCIILYKIFNSIKSVDVTFDNRVDKFRGIGFGRLFEVIFIFKIVLCFGEGIENIFNESLLTKTVWKRWDFLLKTSLTEAVINFNLTP